jgi:MFS family permease
MTFRQYREVLGQRSFRLFWTGFTFSALGDAMTRVALTWYVFETTQSAEALGWLMFLYTGPVILGGLIAGSLLDRFDRRRVMIVDNIIRGTAVLIIPLLHVSGRLALWHIYLAAAVYGMLMMISLAGGPALIPALVRRERLATANAMEMLSFTVGGVLGPVIAGILIPRINAPNVLIIDGVSYLAFALALSRIRIREEPKVSDWTEKPLHTGHAVQLLLKNRILFSTTFMFLAANIGNGILSVWLPILSGQVLGGGSELYGILLGVLAGGEAISALLAGGFVFSLPLGMLISLAQILAGASLLLLLVGPTLSTAVLGLILFGVFSAPLTIWAQTLRMQIIPERLRGRTFALLRMLMQSGNPLGGALGGALLPLLGISAMVLFSSLLIGVPGAIGYQVKTLRIAGSRKEPSLVP